MGRGERESVAADPKMAPDEEATSPETAPISVQPELRELKVNLLASFSRLEASLLEKVSAVIVPLTTKLQEMKSTISEVAQTTESALELGFAAQDQGRLLQQQGDWATERIMHFDNQLRAHNIMLCGFQEGAEGTVDLAIFVADWMAHVLNFEDRIVLLLDFAYRQGPPRKGKGALLRDILVRFADLRSMQRLLDSAHSKGFLLSGTHKILMFPDLSAKTLEARHWLRPINHAPY